MTTHRRHWTTWLPWPLAVPLGIITGLLFYAGLKLATVRWHRKRLLAAAVIGVVIAIPGYYHSEGNLLCWVTGWFTCMVLILMPWAMAVQPVPKPPKEVPGETASFWRYAGLVILAWLIAFVGGAGIMWALMKAVLK